MLFTKGTHMRLYRVVWACVLVSLNGMSSGCAPPSPESISRERLSKIGVQFEKASADMPYANIPAAETGRTVVTVPCYWGGDSPQGWTDEDFKGAIDDLRKLSDMDYLMLRLTRITDRSMGEVASLTQLRHLNLSTLNVTDDGIAKLSTLHNLEGLYFDGSHAITGVGLQSLTDLPLRKLSLRGTAASDETTSALEELTAIEYLDLGMSPVGDTTLSRIGKLPKLKILLLDMTSITDKGVHELLNAKNLERLTVSNNWERIKGVDLREICKLPRLRLLEIGGTGVKKEAVDALRRDFSSLKITWYPYP